MLQGWHVCVSICGGQCLMPGITLHLIDISLHPELIGLANLGSQLAPQIPCLWLLSARIPGGPLCPSGISMGTDNLNSSPNACHTNVLPTELSLYPYLEFWVGVSQWDLGSMTGPDWLASGPQRTSCLQLPRSEITHTHICHQAHMFSWVLWWSSYLHVCTTNILSMNCSPSPTHFSMFLVVKWH